VNRKAEREAARTLRNEKQRENQKNLKSLIMILMRPKRWDNTARSLGRVIHLLAFYSFYASIWIPVIDI